MTEDSVSDDEFFGIGEVLEILLPEFEDLSISKIRFLESQGLIEPQRTYSGFRKFYKKDIERLKWILEQQRDHFLPLKVIKQKLKDIELNREPTPLAKIAELKKTSRKPKKRPLGTQASHLPLKPADYMEQSEIEKALNSIYNEITATGKNSEVNIPSVTTSFELQEDINDDDIRVVEFDDNLQMEAEMEYLNRATSNIDQSLNESGTTNYVLSEDELWVAQQSYDNNSTSVPELLHETTQDLGTPAEHFNHVDAGHSSGVINNDQYADKGTSNEAIHPTNLDADSSSYFTEYESGENQFDSTSEIEEFANLLGCKPELVTEMIDMGFIEPDDIAGVKTFGRECYEIANTLLTYQKYGFELRHIKVLLNAAQRESALYLQALRPILKRKNPDSKYEARELGQVLMRTGARLHQELLRRDLRKELKG